jgi:hypothetical protein
VSHVDPLTARSTITEGKYFAARRSTMQYLLMCCIDESLWTNLPQARRDQVMDAYGRWVEDLKQRRQLVAGAKLDQAARAVTVREKNGKSVVVDGPFAETKEQLGGYHLLECKDRAEAISLAQRIPTLAVGGTIEVRPILYLE